MKLSANPTMHEAWAPPTSHVKEVHTSNHDFNSLLPSIDIAVIVLDADLRVRSFTPAAKDLLGPFVRNENNQFDGSLSRIWDEQLVEEAKYVLDNFVPREAEVNDDSGRIYLRRVQPYLNASNNLEGVVISFADITDRKQIEEQLRVSEQRHRIILDGITEYAIFMVDLNGVIVTWTHAAERLLGFKTDEALGKKMSLIYTLNDLNAGIPAHELKDAIKNGSVSGGRWYARKDGHRFWGTGTLYAFKDNGQDVSGFIKVIRDNTDYKIAEQANEAKDQFLTNISHELRTPLSAILLWAKLLSKQNGDYPEELRNGLQAIKKCAEEQYALVEDLVDISRIASGKMRLERTVMELVPALRSAVDTLRPVAESSGLSIEEYYDSRIGTVYADSHRVHQVIWNLLNNAAKFTPSGGRISVRAELQGDIINIKISDTGKGIRADLLPHIFDRFRQGSEDMKGDSPRQGLGLGLYITRQLVELHGGNITATSPGPGHGATFTIRLTIYKNEESSKNKNVSKRNAAHSLGLRSLIPGFACT